MSGFLLLLLGDETEATHKHTLEPLCQTTDSSLEPVLRLHSTGSITIVKGRRKRKLINDCGSLFGSHVRSNFVLRKRWFTGGKQFCRRWARLLSKAAVSRWLPCNWWCHERCNLSLIPLRRSSSHLGCGVCNVQDGWCVAGAVSSVNTNTMLLHLSHNRASLTGSN